MKSSFRCALLSGALLILSVGPTIAAIGPGQVAGMQSHDKAEIIVTGSPATQSKPVTGLTLFPGETSQSATIAGRQRLDDFALDNLNALLARADQGQCAQLGQREVSREPDGGKAFCVAPPSANISLSLAW